MISFGNERIGSVHRNGLKANSLFFGRNLVFATGEYPLEFTKAGTFYFTFKPGRTYSLTLCGGGGGGAVYGDVSKESGAGGGGGAKVTSKISVQHDTIAKIVIGKGGIGGYDDGAAIGDDTFGESGGDTSIEVSDGKLSVCGGSGGYVNYDKSKKTGGSGGSSYENTGPFTNIVKTNGGAGGVNSTTGEDFTFKGGTSGLGSSSLNGRGGEWDPVYGPQYYPWNGHDGYVKIA